MENGFASENLLDVFIYENTQNIEHLEKMILTSEKASCFTPDTVNEIFRIMHTIKGSSAMMSYTNMASLSHAMEDLFYYIRTEQPETMDYALLSDLVLEGVDFIKLELQKVKNEDDLDGDPSSLIEKIGDFLYRLKAQNGGAPAPAAQEAQMAEPRKAAAEPAAAAANGKSYEAIIHFMDGCEMENMRAYAIVHNIKDIVADVSYFPPDIEDNSASAKVIRENGFRLSFRSDRELRELNDLLASTAFIRSLVVDEVGDAPAAQTAAAQAPASKETKTADHKQLERAVLDDKGSHQSIISVSVVKLDNLMDLMGEMVIAQAMVTQNPELANLKRSNLQKAMRQLTKITNELQEMVMSIRMVPLLATFQKMHRVVRDMGRKLDKEVKLTLIGGETEVDKNIIEHLSDPLMHLVRNAADHGIEPVETRIARGKPKAGQITLEAKNAGSDVLVIVRDDGGGLNKKKILQKAIENGLITNTEKEMTDREIYNLILLPGFSTKEDITEFSGRGVGMDVVVKSLEEVGGVVSIESAEGVGTVTTMKIPLTLAIVDGMNIRVGKALYTLPIASIQETFQPKSKDVISDPDGNEMIMIRGKCYRILRLHTFYGVQTEVTDLEKGIMIIVEHDGECLCIFADQLIGQQQVVVKSMPQYIRKNKKIEGLAGCALMGDGSISLILNVGELIK